MRMIRRIVLAALLIVVVGVVGLIIYMDRVAKTAIEQGATLTLGVKTTLDNIQIGLFSGQVRLEGLEVANPEGFEAQPHFMKLDEGELEVQLRSLASDKVIAPRLALTGIDLVLERKDGKANYEVILDHLQAGEEAPPTEEEAEAKKFAVEEIIIRDVLVHAYLVQIGSQDARPVEVPIDEIRLTYDSEDGTSIHEMTSLILKTVLVAVVQNAGDLLPGMMLDGLSEGLSQLSNVGETASVIVQGAGKTLQEATKVIGKTGGEVGQKLGETSKDLGKSIGDIGKGLGGLLKKDDQKEDGQSDE